MAEATDSNGSSSPRFAKPTRKEVEKKEYPRFAAPKRPPVEQGPAGPRFAAPTKSAAASAPAPAAPPASSSAPRFAVPTRAPVVMGADGPRFADPTRPLAEQMVARSPLATQPKAPRFAKPTKALSAATTAARMPRPKPKAITKAPTTNFRSPVRVAPPTVVAAQRRAIPAKQQRRDVVAEYKFHVQIEGVLKGLFTECNGLTIEREVVSYEEGGHNDYVHKLPGRIKYTNVVLKRGMFLTMELWKWFQEGLYDGKVKRLPVTIILHSTDGREEQRWDLKDAYPVKWTGPNFKADSTQAAIETLELVHHGMTISMG